MLTKYLCTTRNKCFNLLKFTLTVIIATLYSKGCHTQINKYTGHKLIHLVVVLRPHINIRVSSLGDKKLTLLLHAYDRTGSEYHTVKKYSSPLKARDAIQVGLK